MNELIASEKDLWQKAIEHPFYVEICNDSLCIEKFKDTLTQMKLISDVGIRGLLCDTLHHMDPHHPATKHLLHHLNSMHPGGKHFDSVQEMLKEAGVTDPEHVFVLPATESICDAMHRIGHRGHLHEKLLTLLVMVHAVKARVEWMKKRKQPTCPLFSKFVSHCEGVLEHGVEWMHSALDDAISGEVSGTGQMRKSVTKSTTNHPTEQDKYMFKRTLQQMILMHDSCMNRGTWEWPLSQHYHIEGLGRVGGA